MIQRLTLLLVFSALPSMAVCAATVKNLYTASIPLSSENSPNKKETQRNIVLGFTQVIEKLTPVTLSEEQKKKLSPFAWKSVQNYTQKANQLEIVFNSEQIQPLLKKYQLPYWGPQRPLTTVLLVVNRPPNQSVVSRQDHFIANDLKQAAENKGLPIVLPDISQAEHDFQEALAQAIQRHNIERIQQAAAPYQGDAILIGQLTPAFNGWQAQWTLITHQEKRAWNDQETDIRSLLSHAIDKTAETLAVSLAVVPKPHWVRLEVNGISNFKRYQSLIRAIDQVDIVQAHQLKNITAERVEINAEIIGTSRQLAEQLNENRHLSLTNNQGHLLSLTWTESHSDPRFPENINPLTDETAITGDS